MSSPTGQQVRWDPKTRRHYALDGQTGRWVPVEPPNQPRTARPSGLLPGAQAGSLLRSPPSATNSGYTTASPDVTGAINQNQGLNIGNRAGASNQPMIAQGAPLQTKPLDPGIGYASLSVDNDTELSRVPGPQIANEVFPVWQSKSHGTRMIRYIGQC